MAQPTAGSPESSADASARLAELIERFERAWWQGPRPDLGQFLPPAGPLRLAALVELAHIDLECRLKVGEPARVEDYLGRYPELAEVPDAVPSLALAEYRLRRRAEPGLTLTEFLHRFPHHRRRLAHVGQT